jgi:hypothetical protein
MTTPTPTNYGHFVAKPDVPNITINSSIPAPVSTTNGGSVIASNQERNAAQNVLVLQQAGRKVGGRSRRTHKKKSKRSKHYKKSKRSKKTRRHKRGGSIITTTTTTTNTTPSKPSVAPVPQFAGAHNAGANTNSLAGNHLLMKAGSQAVYDDPNAPGTHTLVN